MSEQQQTIFNQQTPSAASVDIATSTNVQSNQPFADLLGSIKNERGEPKYKDVQTALEALRHSQEFIPQLKQDKEATEAKLNALAVEVERLKNIEQSITQLTQQQQAQQQTTAPASISEEAVANLINQTLSAKEKQALASNNLNTVVSKVQQAFGEDAEKTFYSKATELGMTAEQINSLAAQSPTAVLKLFGIEGKPSNQTSGNPINQGSVNTAGLQPQVNSFISKNSNVAQVGATTAELQAECDNSKKLVEELHSKGMTTADLTDPKTYFKHFK